MCVSATETVCLYRKKPAITSKELMSTAFYRSRQPRSFVIEPPNLVCKMAREKTVEGNYVFCGAPLLILKTLIENLRPV